MHSIGEQFRAARQQRNLSIDEVSKLTKIGARVIESIEEGNFKSLPPTYMRSFVRTYAHFLDIPEPTDINLGDNVGAERFQPQATEQVSPLSMPQNVFTPSYFSDQRVRNKRILTTIYIAVACLLSVVGYLVFSAPPLPRKADDTAINRPLRIIAEAIKPISASRDSSFEAMLQNTDSMILEARAIESVWMNIVMDKKRTDQQTLESGKNYRWSAEKVFSLSIGNAGGVYFTLNGKPLDQFGAKGVVVRDVRITRDAVRGEIINSSNTPTIVRNLNSPVPNPQPAASQPRGTVLSTVQSTAQRAAASTSVQSSVQSQQANTSQASSTVVATKSDSLRPRPRFSFRQKAAPKTLLIDPVVPRFAPPKPTAFKPLGTKPDKN
jgi:cytoskeleton protein RodZ